IFLGPVLTGSTTTMMAPVTLLALRGRAQLPLWLGVLGAVAFFEQAAETITIFGARGFLQPGGAMNMQLGAMLTLTWLLAFGVWGGVRANAMSPAWPEQPDTLTIRAETSTRDPRDLLIELHSSQSRRKSQV